MSPASRSSRRTGRASRSSRAWRQRPTCSGCVTPSTPTTSPPSTTPSATWRSADATRSRGLWFSLVGHSTVVLAVAIAVGFSGLFLLVIGAHNFPVLLRLASVWRKRSAHGPRPRAHRRAAGLARRPEPPARRSPDAACRSCLAALSGGHPLRPRLRHLLGDRTGGSASQAFENRSQVKAPVEEELYLSEVAMRVLPESECLVRAGLSSDPPCRPGFPRRGRRRGSRRGR